MSEQHPTLPSPLIIGHKSDGRCVYSKEAKRALVELALRPGASVAKLARQNDLNANVLRRWIVVHQKGLKTAPASLPSASTLVPVIERKERPVTVSPKRNPDRAIDPSIEIDVAGVTIRLCGMIDGAQLRTVLDCVRQP